MSLPRAFTRLITNAECVTFSHISELLREKLPDRRTSRDANLLGGRDPGNLVTTSLTLSLPPQLSWGLQQSPNKFPFDLSIHVPNRQKNER